MPYVIAAAYCVAVAFIAWIAARIMAKGMIVLIEYFEGWLRISDHCAPRE